MIESPLGRLVGASMDTGAKEGAWSICVETGAGKSSSPVKLKTSKENARSRPWKIGKSASAGALSAFPPVRELRSEKSNVEAAVYKDSRNNRKVSTPKEKEKSKPAS